MEKNLPRNELLLSLLKKASNPFTSMEQKLDVKRILMESVTMQGMNHLFLAQCHFDSNPLFYIDEKEALHQARLAYQENNPGAYYYLYLLLKEKKPMRAKSYLLLSCTAGNPKAYYELGKLYFHGELFKKDLDKAYENFSLAAKCNVKEGYFGMLLVSAIQGKIEQEKEVYQMAKENGIELPGVVE